MDNSNNQKIDNSNNQKIDNSNNMSIVSNNLKINDSTNSDNFNYFYQDDEIKNLCLDCSVDMGPTNPRQLCGKTHCNNL